MFFLTILIAILVLLCLYLGTRKPEGFPPGPRWWPILGSALEVSRLRKNTGCLYETFIVLFKRYGPIFGLKIGKDRIVILNSYETIHSMLTNEDCDGRPSGPFYETRTWGKRRGVLVTDGPLWIEQRRFVLRHLREFGFGRTTMASLIEEEAMHLMNHLKKLCQSNNRLAEKTAAENANRGNAGQIYQLTSQCENDSKTNDNTAGLQDISLGSKIAIKVEDLYVKPEDYGEIRNLSQSYGMTITMNNVFNISVLNTLWKMIAGKRYSNDDKEMMYIQRLLTKLMKEIDMIGCLFSHFPILRYIAPQTSGYKKFLDIHQQIWVFLNEELENHKTTFNPDQLRDLMDVYINKSQTTSGESYSESQILATCMDLFMAGSETTSNTLDTCFLYLVLCPEIQKKAQMEVDAVVGRDRLPVLADRPRMPYIDAIVLESLRMFMGRTFSIPHRTLKDTLIAGYRIPKDTMVLANFNRVLMDEFWGDPEVFKPERFINETGNITIPNQYLPFSHGKHRCMGEVLAKSSLFLFIAALLQNFTFSPVPGEENKPSIEFLDGVTISPKPYRTLVTLRV